MLGKLTAVVKDDANSTGFIKQFSVLLVFLIFGSISLLAQEPADSFDQLHLLLGQGDKVTVVDMSGNTIKGRVERVEPNALDVRVKDEVRSFRENDVRQINQKRHDSVLNGILIGAGIGFAGTLPINLGIAEDDEKGLAVAASALWGLIGGCIGGLVDFSVTQKQLVYFRPKKSISWSIRPFYSNSTSQFPKSRMGAFLLSSRQYMGNDPSRGIALTLRF